MTGRKRVFMWIAACALACVLAGGVMVGVAQTGRAGDGADAKPARIVSTIFPLYDWVNAVLGENPGNLENVLLVQSGADLHSYQPSVDDIIMLSTCDALVYVGGESDGWVRDVLTNAANGDMAVVDCIRALGDAVKREELVEGMQAEHAHDEDAEETDEHVWLSLRNARVLTQAIAQMLTQIDPANERVYRENAEAYCVSLDALDREYAATVADAKYHAILFADRFPFRYLADDYGLTYYAAFAGCSAETEASFQTIVFLSDKLKELGLPAVLVMERSDQAIARTVLASSDDADRPILVLDSMQSATIADAQNGYTYLAAMRENLLTLTRALG